MIPEKKVWKGVRAFLCCLSFLIAVPAGSSLAATAREIDVSVDVALEQFEKTVNGGRAFLDSAKGVLVFPSVVKAGIGVGGEYGEGALRIGGKTADYYNTVSASVGFQLGAQVKSILLVFMTDESLRKFRKNPGWEAGVDGSAALVKIGAGGSIDTTTIKEPIVAFVFGQKGLMYNLTLEGSKFTRLDKKE
ncbi:MAG TPA: YSC84-related protein [Syntrophales bacterium]|nr:YSC84-related protein [Syntrophales bacterium]HPX11173.1 YSC84-related protein [Syntrophales bacterium]HQN77567.1 YSC84-related protein [Syntrophales bacterium]HQQ26523.1 YSC84-related protein [Syntrophales bacterium]